jgi:hypothetical protein
VSLGNSEWKPACSFCGSEVDRGLVRAGGRDYWICSLCVDRPTVEDSVAPGTPCTFCEWPVRKATSLLRGAVRTVAAARRGVMICSECLPVCAGIITEDRRLWGRHPRG